MRNPGRIFTFLFISLLVAGINFFPVTKLYADGKYYPAQAYKVPPAIPSQRVVLTYKDGIEVLIVESSLEGEGKEFGWIIPLPSKPTEFEKVSPGFTNTLSTIIQPEVIHEIWHYIATLFMLSIVVFACCTYTFIIRLRIYIVIVSIVLAVFIALSIFRTSGHLSKQGGLGVKDTAISGVRVSDVQEIGSYQVAVLEADNAEALDRWLTSNGFIGLATEDKAIVSDYVKEGWCFITAKLRREGSGYSQPHPLAMTFASSKPIYPMRLTALTGSNVYLELFIIADRQATNEKLVLELSDKYRFKKKAEQGIFKGQHLAGFTGKTYQQDIGHPLAQKLMWDECVLTRLCGTVRPNQMKDDIVLKLNTAEPYRKRYFSRTAAIGAACHVGMGGWCVLLIVLTCIYYRKVVEENREKVYWKRIIKPATLYSLLLFGVTYAVIPKLANVKTVKNYGYSLRNVRKGLAGYMATEIRQQNDFFKRKDMNEVARVVNDYFNTEFDLREMYGAYIGKELKQGDSPGNYAILEDEQGEIVLRFYSEEGYPYDFPLTSTPEKPYAD